jgi:DNA-directed RNA polymerase subunit RPC12/RpoP
LVNPAEYETECERDGDIESHHQHQGHWHLPFEPMALGCPRKVAGPFSRGDFGQFLDSPRRRKAVPHYFSTQAASQYLPRSAAPHRALSALIWINAHPFNSCSNFFMLSFTYRCPRTGQEVHGHVVVELINGQTYKLVTCTACGGTHLINPKTSRLLERANQDGQAFRAS